MTFWILAGVAVHYLAVYLPAFFVLGGIGVGGYVGSRDAEPETGVYLGRARRVLRNAQESFAAFLGLALLSMIVPDADMGGATVGAMMYVLGRIAYIPLYLFAVPMVRSAAWVVSILGLIRIAVAIV